MHEYIFVGLEEKAMNRFTFHIKRKVSRRVIGLLVQCRKVHNAREDQPWEAGGRVGSPDTSSGSRTFQHPTIPALKPYSASPSPSTTSSNRTQALIKPWHPTFPAQMQHKVGMHRTWLVTVSAGL